MDMKQPKPSLSKTSKILQIPVRDELMIPDNRLSALSIKYEVPDETIEKVYHPMNRIKNYEPDHAYDYDFYVSGGMSGHPNHNFAMFHAMTGLLREYGFRVFNPAENFGSRTDLSRSTYMRKDQSAITRCGNILTLPSWKESQGAIGEVNNALSIPDMGIFMFIRPQKTKNQHKPIIIKLQR